MGSDLSIAQIDIISSRVFSAPRDLLFGLFADPMHLAQWWGPHGFTNTFQHFDFEAGGSWRLVMQAPDGTEYTQDKQFTEVIVPERIVFRHLQEGHGFEHSMTYADHKDGTLLTWRMLFDPGVGDPAMQSFIIGANEENLDRLEMYLGSQTTGPAK